MIRALHPTFAFLLATAWLYARHVLTCAPKREPGQRAGIPCELVHPGAPNVERTRTHIRLGKFSLNR